MSFERFVVRRTTCDPLLQVGRRQWTLVINSVIQHVWLKGPVLSREFERRDSHFLRRAVELK